MKFFYDLFPLLAFFIVYQSAGIFPATMAAVLAALLQLAVGLLQRKKPDMMQLITTGTIVTLGSATLLFKNELFIKWKPTIVYWLFAILLLLMPKLYNKNLVQKILGKTLTLSQQGWAVLNKSWYQFFLFMGALNLAVVYLFDTKTWVNFKVFGTFGLTLFFIIIQAVLITRMSKQCP